MKIALAPYLKPAKLFHYGVWGLLLFLLSQRLPSWIANYTVEGKAVETFTVVRADGASQNLPHPHKRQIIVFWATWCKPCELELDRFNRAVKDKEMSSDAVIAISVGEDPALVFAEARTRDYAFTVLADPQNASTRSLEVQGTPQVYHIDEKGKVAYASMGLSPLSILRGRYFLKDDEAH